MHRVAMKVLLKLVQLVETELDMMLAKPEEREESVMSIRNAVKSVRKAMVNYIDV